MEPSAASPDAEQMELEARLAALPSPPTKELGKAPERIQEHA